MGWGLGVTRPVVWRVWDLKSVALGYRCGVWGVGCGVWGVGCGMGFRVWASGPFCRARHSWFRTGVEGLGFGV